MSSKLLHGKNLKSRHMFYVQYFVLLDVGSTYAQFVIIFLAMLFQ